MSQPGVAQFGPGTLTIGATGSEIDASVLLNKCTISATKDQSDPTTKLSGAVRAGKVSYRYEMTGNVDVDIATSAGGLFALSQSAPGSEQPFKFTPSTAAGTAAAGTLVIDPLDFGADEYGADMTSDFTWSLVGAPAYTYPAP